MGTTLDRLAHPDMADPQVLGRIADRLKRELRAERVIVFGSVARGEATVHSDIDLLVVAPGSEKVYRRMAQARAAVRDLSAGLPLSPWVLTPDELRSRWESGDPFIREVLEEGIEL